MDKKELSVLILNSIRRDKIQKFNVFNNKSKGIFAILSILYEYKEGVSSGEIAKKLMFSTARMAVALQTLAKKGYIKKERATEDSRKTIVTITDTGIRLFECEQRKIVMFLEKFFSTLTDEEVDSLGKIANKLLENFE